MGPSAWSRVALCILRVSLIQQFTVRTKLNGSEDQLSIPDGSLYWQKSEVQDTSNACITICIRGGGKLCIRHVCIVLTHVHARFIHFTTSENDGAVLFYV